LYPNLQIGILTIFLLIIEIHVYIIDYWYQGNYCAKKFNPMNNINMHLNNITDYLTTNIETMLWNVYWNWQLTRMLASYGIQIL
jgi:hypothetical protein